MHWSILIRDRKRTKKSFLNNALQKPQKNFPEINIPAKNGFDLRVIF